MKDQPIGFTACPDCRGTGKRNEGEPCPICKGTGLMAVYSAPAERPIEQE
jgi:DnaJ-class molecular chaperone